MQFISSTTSPRSRSELRLSDEKINSNTNNNNKPRKPPIPHHIPSSPVVDELWAETKTINTNIDKPMKIPAVSPDIIVPNTHPTRPPIPSNNKISNIKQNKKAIIKSKRARPNPTKRRQQLKQRKALERKALERRQQLKLEQKK
eukprot:454001_1